MKHVHAPESYTSQSPVIFLAGSIEMGRASKWQDQIVDACQDIPGTILNPRRELWEPHGSQGMGQEPFTGQVSWELTGICTSSHLVVFYFDPSTLSPISLLELGLVLGMGKRALVCCPPSFYRSGNIEITCARFSVPVVHTLDELISGIREYARVSNKSSHL